MYLRLWVFLEGFWVFPTNRCVQNRERERGREKESAVERFKYVSGFWVFPTNQSERERERERERESYGLSAASAAGGHIERMF